ncbi:MAG: prolipoprotein diacylglyceryl transferase [Pyrinomonadaceae bacterium]|nr:prolipoprotein diacylglyceryl transferase [Pyrinomonadaceae bacterium]
MRRVLLHWGNVSIHSYPVMLYLGIVFGIYAQLFATLSIRLDIARTLGATLLLLLAALLGSRLLFVITNWARYRVYPRRIWRFSDGGASMYGGLLLALPVSLPLLVLLEIPFGAFWDVASFTLLIGLMVTRVGCLLSGCCAGRPTSGWFGLNLPDHRGRWSRRIPTQILESAWGTAVLAGALISWGRLPFQGALFLYSVGAYGAGRIVLESARDKRDRGGGINLPQAISAGFVTSSLVAFAIAWWRAFP